jgi:hypothetical protein
VGKKKLEYYRLIGMSTMKAVWVDGKTQTVKELPIPEPGEGQVLIKVVCAAQNPKDWKGSFLTRGFVDVSSRVGWCAGRRSRK